RGEALQVGAGARPADLDLRERRDVEQADALAAREVLGDRDRRPLARRPLRRRPVAAVGTEARGVGLVPLRALPPGALEEPRPEARLALVERRAPQAAGLLGML